MTRNRRYKAAVRARQQATGEPYTAARRQTLTLDEVMEREPMLNDFGFGGRFGLADELERLREQLRRHEPLIIEVRDWLLENVQPTKRPTQGSYGLKHLVEEAIGEYVSNGELIAAALMAGYPMRYRSGPNATFAMSRRDLNRLQRRA